MADCSHDLQLEHSKMLAILENDVDALKTMVAGLNNIDVTLAKLTMLNEQEIEFNKQQVRWNDKSEKTMIAISDTMAKIGNRVEKLEDFQASEQLTHKQQSVEDSRIKSERYKANMVFWGVLVTSISTIIILIITLAYDRV